MEIKKIIPIICMLSVAVMIIWGIRSCFAYWPFAAE